MFDDCRSALSSHVHRLYSLIKLHAFFLKEEREEKKNKTERQRLLFRFLYELHFIVSFEMRFCVCWTQAASWMAIFHFTLHATTAFHFEMEREQFGCFGKWATEIFQNKSQYKHTHTHIGNKKMNIYYNYNAVIFSLFSSFSISSVASLLNYAHFIFFQSNLLLSHFDVGSRRKSILIFVSYVCCYQFSLSLSHSILCLRLLLAISFIQRSFFLIRKSKRK